MVDKKYGDPTGSITQVADAQNQRIAGISNVSKTVNAMNKQTNRQIQDIERDIGQNKDIQAIESSMSRVLKKLSETVGTLNKGVSTITVGTAKATKDAISQYGKALNEDIGFQKKNFLAMTLAKATPLFGYFATKFMETDVFKNAAAKMKDNISRGLSGVWGGVKGMFGKGGPKRGRAEMGQIVSKKIPKMQKGGYVEKGGLVRVHAGEVIAPIEKVLERVDDSISTAKNLANIARKTQLSALSDMKTYVKGETEKAPKGLIKGFVSAYASVVQQYQEPTDKRQLRALLAIQDALGAQVGTMRQVWAKFLIEQPFFRNMLTAAQVTRSAFGRAFIRPITWAFRRRGTYHSDLSKDHNPMRAMSENMGALYVGTLWRLDNIALFTRRAAEATTDISAFFTGRQYPKLKGVHEPGWSIMGLIKKGIGKFLRFTVLRPIGGLIGGLVMMIAEAQGKGQKGRMLLRKFAPGSTRIAQWFRRRKEKRAMHRFGIPGFGGGGRRMRAGMLEQLYGKSAEGGEGGGGGRGSRARQIRRMMPKLIRNQAKYYHFGQQVMKAMVKRLPQEKKEARRMITMTAGVEKELKKANRRERLKNALSMVMSAGGFIWDIVSGLVGKVTGWIGGLFAAGGLLASAALWGPVVLAIMGALGAAGIALWIRNNLILPFLGRREEQAQKGRAGVGITQASIMEIKQRQREGTATPEDMAVMQRLGSVSAGMRRMKAKRKSTIGGFGREKVYEAVTDAQNAYMRENISEYLKYAPEEVDRMRHDWLSTPGAKKLEMFGDTYKLGFQREKSFVKYLHAYGNPLYEYTAGYQLMKDIGEPTGVGAKIRKGVGAAGKFVREKTAGIKIDKAIIVESPEAAALIASTGAAWDQAKTYGKGAKKLASEVGNQTVLLTNNISSLATSTVNAAKGSAEGQAFGQMLGTSGDYFVEKVAKGAIE